MSKKIRKIEVIPTTDRALSREGDQWDMIVHHNDYQSTRITISDDELEALGREVTKALGQIIARTKDRMRNAV